MLVDVEDLNKELQDALNRVTAREKRECSLLLNQVKELKNQMIQNRSDIIYARKELEVLNAGSEGINPDDLPPKSQASQLNSEIYELNLASVNHNIVRSTLQKATHNIQMQNAVHEELSQMEAKDDVDSSSGMLKILDNYSSNLHTSKTLLDLINTREELDERVLQSRLKTQSIFRNIKKKWERLEDKASVDEEIDDDELKQIRSKLESRESKIKMIIYMVQNLVSGSGLLWGADDYFVKLMLVCDGLLYKGSGINLEEECKALSEIRSAREKSNTSSLFPRKPVTVATSTPVLKKSKKKSEPLRI